MYLARRIPVLYPSLKYYPPSGHSVAEGMRTIERDTCEVHAHMDMVMKDNRARESGQLATN